MVITQAGAAAICHQNSEDIQRARAPFAAARSQSYLFWMDLLCCLTAIWQACCNRETFF